VVVPPSRSRGFGTIDGTTPARAECNRGVKLRESPIAAGGPTFGRVRLVVEFEDGRLSPVLPDDGRDFVAFMSFAVTRGFGATHPLIALAERLQSAHGVAMGPLTTFYGEEVEDAEDREKQEMSWQDTAVLLAPVAAMAEALQTDGQAIALLRRAGAEGLAEQAAALSRALAETTSPRVRLGYVL